MESTKRRLKEPKDLLVMTDGYKSYESLYDLPSLGSPTARYATDEEDASRKSDTESTGASPTSNSSSVGKVQELWRSSPGRRTALGGGWRRSWRPAGPRQAQPLLGHRAPEWDRQEDERLPGKKKPGFRAKRGESGGSWMVASALVYNFCRAQRGLRVPLCVSEGRRRYERRTPAMVANLTDFIWTVADVLRTPVYPAGGAR